MKNQFTKNTIGGPAQWLIDAGADIGLSLAHLTHEVTDHFKNHVINKHGDPATNGAATITEADFARIPGIINAPDMAIIGAERKGSRFNVYVKAEAGVTFFYFEEILDSNRNRALRSSTFYKITRPQTLDEVLRNVTRNNKTDVSKAKIWTRPQP
jgi:hypothetical protein